MRKVVEKIKNAKNKKSLIIMFIGAVLFVSGTLAYYTSTADFENLFSAASYGSFVQETFVSPTDWTPGDTTAKTLTVTNDGDVDLKARVKITETWESANGTTLSNSLGGNLGNAAIINFHSNSGWTKMSCGSPAVTYYVYDDVLEPEDVSETLLDSVTYNTNVEGTYNCTTSTSGGVTTQRCQTGQGYNGGTYTLRFDVETIQSDAYSSWSCTTYQGEEEEPTPVTQKYKIIFNGNGATGGSVGDLTCTIDADCILSSNGFTRTGYTFQGWATSANGEKVYDNQATVRNLTTANNNFDLYAVWQEDNGEEEPSTDPDPITPLTGTVHYHGNTQYVTLTQSRIWKAETDIGQGSDCNDCVWKANYDLSVASSDGSDLSGYQFRIGLNSGVTGYECNGGNVTVIDSSTLLFAPYGNEGSGESPITKESACQFWYTTKDGYVTIIDDNTGASADPVSTISGNVTYKNESLTVDLNYVRTETASASDCGGTSPCYGLVYTYEITNNGTNAVNGFSFRINLNSNVVGASGYGLKAIAGDGTYYTMKPHDTNTLAAGGTRPGTATGDFIVYTKAVNSTFAITTDPDNEFDNTLYYTKTVDYGGSQLKIELTKDNGWSSGGNYIGQYKLKLTNVGDTAITGWSFDFIYTSKFTGHNITSLSTENITGGVRVKPQYMGNTYAAGQVIDDSQTLQLIFTDDTGAPNIGD